MVKAKKNEQPTAMKFQAGDDVSINNPHVSAVEGKIVGSYVVYKVKLADNVTVECPEQSLALLHKNYWAICQFYEPFGIGNVLQFIRYPVKDAMEGTVNEWKVFYFQNPVNKVWYVHETTTGGFIGEGKTAKKALAEAKKNLDNTPDFSQQVKDFGDPMRFFEVTTEEAFKRLAK